MKPIAKIRLNLLANRAAPSPILGQALGQYSINIMDFCKVFNNATKNIKDTVRIPVNITIYNQTTWEIQIKTPSTSDIIKNILHIQKGTGTPVKGLFSAGKNKTLDKRIILTLKEIFHVALFKKCSRSLHHIPLQSISKTLLGSIKTLGVGISSYLLV